MRDCFKWPEINHKVIGGVPSTKPIKKVLAMVRSGKITDGQTIMALTYAALELGIYKK